MNNSLYELIKQKSKEKGCPLKIICDWDECLQTVNPLIWWKFAREKGWKLEKENFREWFEYYWKNARIEYKQNIPYTVYISVCKKNSKSEIRLYAERSGKESLKTLQGYFDKHPFLTYLPISKNFAHCNTATKEIEEIRNKDPDWWSKERVFNENVRKPVFKIMNASNYYEEVPFLSIAEELLECLKEKLISKLVVITASPGGPDSRKRKKFNKTFSKFSNCELILEKPGRFRERRELRWEKIKKIHPDFDIFIDDSPTIIADSQKNLPLDKLFIILDYKLNRPSIQKKDDIQFIKNAVSDLRNSDFSIVFCKKESKNQLETLSLGIGGYRNFHFRDSSGGDLV